MANPGERKTTALYSICRAVIHNLKVTAAHPLCEGSVLIDADLVERIGFFPGEEVLVANVSRGGRARTYVVPGPRGSGVVETSGSLSRLAEPGDLVCVMSFVLTDNPHGVVRVDLNARGENRV